MPSLGASRPWRGVLHPTAKHFCCRVTLSGCRSSKRTLHGVVEAAAGEPELRARTAIQPSQPTVPWGCLEPGHQALAHQPSPPSFFCLHQDLAAKLRRRRRHRAACRPSATSTAASWLRR